MSTYQFSHSKALNNIPVEKLNAFIASIPQGNNHHLKIGAVNRYYESNIPVEYWRLRMDKHFQGNEILKGVYDDFTKNAKESYDKGTTFCLAGTHGAGKTMTITCILKKAVEKDFTALYTTISDIVSVLTTAPPEERYMARRELLTVDFLAIDEFDPRFIGSDSAADLYARTLEGIFRSRVQNHLSTMLASNSPNPKGIFTGALKESLDSLFSGYVDIIPIYGKDHRKVLEEIRNGH
jgi:DNA replication protein DnaC